MEDAHRVCGTEHCYGTGKPDAAGARRSRSQNEAGGGIKKFFAVMLADAKHIQAGCVRVLYALKQFRKCPGALRRVAAVRA